MSYYTSKNSFPAEVTFNCLSEVVKLLIENQYSNIFSISESCI